MGSSGSTPENPDTKVDNVKKLFNIEDEQDILESLNISELHQNEKLPLPIIGGNEERKNKKEDDNLDHDLDYELDIDFNLVGGSKKQDPRFVARRRRYLRHNVFKILNELEGKQKGGNANAEEEEERYLSTSSDDTAIKQIKEIILKEVNKINTDGNMQNGGGCGCEGKNDDEQDGGAKKRKAKAKKGKKTYKGGDRKKAAEPKDDSSSSSSSSSSDDEDDTEASYKSSLNQSESSLDNESQESDNSEKDEDEDEDEDDESEDDSESQNGGLSIFPFNSSEVKSSVSEKKNMRMIRRKI